MTDAKISEMVSKADSSRTDEERRQQALDSAFALGVFDGRQGFSRDSNPYWPGGVGLMSQAWFAGFDKTRMKKGEV